MLKLALLPISWIYRILAACHRAWVRCYKPYHLPVPVISVGNISMGGTGKTEMVATLCRELLAAGRKPGVLIRGYGRKSREPVVVVSQGQGKPCVTVQEAGDEAYLLATQLPQVPVIVGKDRIATGKEAIRRFGCNILVLDDGFQRRDHIARDLDIVLLDASDPWGGSQLLPAGRLREPLSSLKAADIIVLTRADQYAKSSMFSQLAKLAPGKPVLTARHAPQFLSLLNQNRRENLEYLGNHRVVAVSGIGNPDSFKRVLQKLDACVTDHMYFPDHHWYTPADCARIHKQAYALDSEIVTTTKDAVRFLGCESINFPIWVLQVRLIILTPGEGLRPHWERAILRHSGKSGEIRPNSGKGNPDTGQ